VVVVVVVDVAFGLDFLACLGLGFGGGTGTLACGSGGGTKIGGTVVGVGGTVTGGTTTTGGFFEGNSHLMASSGVQAVTSRMAMMVRNSFISLARRSWQ